MSNQFSYELDERQIRILMQDAESDYNESLWNKYESIEPTTSCKSTSVQIGNYIPKFNLSISRSIIVPVLFIILIGGLSAMLFSFVDFKKKENIDKEIPLVANPENFKKPEVTTAKVIKPSEAKINPAKTIVASTPTINTSPTATTAITIAETKQPEPVKIVESTPKEKTQPTAEVKKEAVPVVIKKKTKKKIKAEELPTIKAVTNLNEGVNEPELDLDLK
jgi:cytoskeletal protein RodZ